MKTIVRALLWVTPAALSVATITGCGGTLVVGQGHDEAADEESFDPKRDRRGALTPLNDEGRRGGR